MTYVPGHGIVSFSLIALPSQCTYSALHRGGRSAAIMSDLAAETNSLDLDESGRKLEHTDRFPLSTELLRLLVMNITFSWEAEISPRACLLPPLLRVNPPPPTPSTMSMPCAAAEVAMSTAPTASAPPELEAALAWSRSRCLFAFFAWIFSLSIFLLSAILLLAPCI